MSAVFSGYVLTSLKSILSSSHGYITNRLAVYIGNALKEKV